MGCLSLHQGGLEGRRANQRGRGSLSSEAVGGASLRWQLRLGRGWGSRGPTHATCGGDEGVGLGGLPRPHPGPPRGRWCRALRSGRLTGCARCPARSAPRAGPPRAAVPASAAPRARWPRGARRATRGARAGGEVPSAPRAWGGGAPPPADASRARGQMPWLESRFQVPESGWRWGGATGWGCREPTPLQVFAGWCATDV